MLVHTPFRKSWECEISTRILLNLTRSSKLVSLQPHGDLNTATADQTYDASSSSSHTQASRSKWFVGSSSSNMKGLMNRALRRQTAAIRGVKVQDEALLTFICQKREC